MALRSDGLGRKSQLSNSLGVTSVNLLSLSETQFSQLYNPSLFNSVCAYISYIYIRYMNLVDIIGET